MEDSVGLQDIQAEFQLRLIEDAAGRHIDVSAAGIRDGALQLRDRPGQRLVQAERKKGTISPPVADDKLLARPSEQHFCTLVMGGTGWT